jgi:AcrR family transcriptional regulator
MNGRPSARDRLVETAARLFYERGLPNVGINEVTDRADVARMTLYNNFASKEELALAAFERQAALRRTMIEAHLARARAPRRRLDALFDVAEELASQADFKGCAFINVVLQRPEPGGRLHRLVKAHKGWIKQQIRDAAVAAGAKRADRLAQQVLAMWDGAIVEAYIQGSVAPIVAGREASRTLLAAAIAEPE